MCALLALVRECAADLSIRTQKKRVGLGSWSPSSALAEARAQLKSIFVYRRGVVVSKIRQHLASSLKRGRTALDIDRQFCEEGREFVKL